MKTHESRPDGPAPKKRLRRAQHKTKAVVEQLEVAGGELQLTKTVIEEGLQQIEKSPDVAQALVQQGAIEEKVLEAADELQEVHGLLEEEVAERERLEQELAQALKRPGGR